MIILEDERIESAVKEHAFDIALPADVYVPVDGEPVITAYEMSRGICEEFEKTYPDPLSPEALSALKEKLTPLMDSLGYEPDRQTCRVVLEYICDGASPAGEAKIVTDPAEAEAYPCALLHGPELCGEGDAAAIITDNGTIVCCAGINDLGDEGECELYVETAPDFRRRGYATSAVSSLAAYLRKNGDVVSYKCGEDNIPSARVAEKSGFRLVGRRASAVYYEKEN